jgi:hypothetical protein
MKLFYEEKLRRRFGRAQAKTDADADDAAAQELVDGVVKDLSFGELVKGDANDIAAAATDSESEIENTDSDESDSDDSSSEEDDTSTSGDPTPTTGTPSAPTPTVRKSRSPVKPVTHDTARSRSRPTDHRNRPMHAPTAHNTPSNTPLPRPRLRPSKSFSGSISSGSGSTIPPVPPLPGNKPLPQMPRSADSNKPLPANPAHNRQNLSAGYEFGRRPPSAINRKRKRRGAAAIEPPQLVHVPQLLPLFLEMVSE